MVISGLMRFFNLMIAKMEGVFRITANNAEINKVVQLVDAGNAHELDFHTIEDRHVPSGKQRVSLS
jgi:hypothetical protein